MPTMAPVDRDGEVEDVVVVVEVGVVVFWLPEVSMLLEGVSVLGIELLGSCCLEGALVERPPTSPKNSSPSRIVGAPVGALSREGS